MSGPRLSRTIAPLSWVLPLVVLAGCGSSERFSEPDPNADPALPRTRYSFNNRCFALKSVATGNYVVADGANAYAATAATPGAAEGFYLKPAALGDYLLHDRSGMLVAAGAATGNPDGPTCVSGTVCNLALPAATDAARFVVTAAGDATPYPAAPQFDVEPDAAALAAWRAFADPQVAATRFTLASQPDGRRLAVDAGNALVMAAADDSAAQQFALEALTAASCATFPEADSNASGETFKGSTVAGHVLGMADVHVHVGSTTFLGDALSGTPFHRFGVTHALSDCDDDHGPDGSRDFVGTFLGGFAVSHATTGWPDFNDDWPSAHSLTHQAIYWKWLERAWLAGLRVIVNDLVENATLCELQRNNSSNPGDCNEMNSAGRQAGTMYAMQDYVDAQYGGPGAGWLRIVQGPDEARDVIEAGRLAMVLGIEVSNFLNCQPTYHPLRQQEPYEETGAGAPENDWGCRMTETGADDEVLTQLQRIQGWGVRQVISIHEFDNAFGGNGIFFPIINVGNRENSGGIPASSPGGPFAADPDSPTGEFWTTYNCPEENVTPGFSGYLWGDQGGAAGADLRDGGTGAPSPAPPACQFTGQNGRPGGATACYPDARQCNARWMTPIGLYLYGKLMELGFIFDFDHMELAMKTQALELAEAQPIAYPFVSTHGTYGGTSNDQARRVLRNGGFLYPAIDSSAQMRRDLDETLQVYEQALADVPAAERPLFGFGFGTDTNGLSAQAGAEPGVSYPFTLFQGAGFDELADFNLLGASVRFDQPRSGTRTWDIAADGSAHYGMLSEFVEALRVHGTPQQLQAVFNSAERFLQTWERTEDATAAIAANGGVAVPAGVLRPAPLAGQTSDLP